MNLVAHRLVKRLMGAAFSIFLGLCLLTSFSVNFAEAASTSMSGNYQNDTIFVARSLQETIEIPKDDEGRSKAEKESVQLITDYISRYRNRSEVNGSLSFTTMQTALNAMAGHYKTFSNRALPDDLKARLQSELTKAEQLAAKES